MRKSKKYVGQEIICEYDSSNIKEAKYLTNDKKLIVKFNNGSEYEYDNVPHDIFTKFDVAESQGKVFNKEIAKNFKYKKIN